MSLHNGDSQQNWLVILQTVLQSEVETTKEPASDVGTKASQKYQH